MIILEATPPNIDPELILEQLNAVCGVLDTHDLHVWTLTPGKMAMTAHILVSESEWKDYDRIQLECQQVLRGHKIYHVTIQPEKQSASNSTTHLRACQEHLQLATIH